MGHCFDEVSTLYLLIKFVELTYWCSCDHVTVTGITGKV